MMYYLFLQLNHRIPDTINGHYENYGRVTDGLQTTTDESQATTHE